ncbi:MAG: DUF4350 domain-containing protein, partial [Planctomycetota bacterium]
GLYETLAELNVEVERGVAPPDDYLTEGTVLAFLGPEPRMIRLEPAHLQTVAEWVKAGGTILYAPANTSSWRSPRQPEPGALGDSNTDASATPKSFWQLMGIPEIELSRLDVGQASSNGDVELRRAPRKRRNRDVSFRDATDSMLNPKDRPIITLSVRPTGDWENSPNAPATIAVPRHGVTLLKADATWPAAADGGLVVRSREGEDEYWLSASFPVGAGSVVVLSDPVFAENGFVARQDNAVLMAALLTAGGRRVVFDEFYHGLTARGNPLVLLRRPGFTLLLLFICMKLAVYAWRHGQRLGPAMSVHSATRRSLSEYVEAMARLFVKGRDRSAFLVRENRDGLNWMLQQELGLSPSKRTVDQIHSLLARRDPQRADSYRACARRFDQLLSQSRPNERDVLDVMKRVTDCL